MQGVALQYSALGGVGYAAAGTLHAEGDRDYRYGTTPQGLLALRLIFSDRAMVDMNGREYYISEWNGTNPDGHEQIGRANVGFTVRVVGQHALGLQLTSTTRDSHVDDIGDRHQAEEVASIVYTLLGDDMVCLPMRSPPSRRTAGSKPKGTTRVTSRREPPSAYSAVIGLPRPTRGGPLNRWQTPTLMAFDWSEAGSVLAER